MANVHSCIDIHLLSLSPGGAPYLTSHSAKVEAVELPHSVMVEGGRVARVEKGKVVAPNKDKYLLTK